jgi:hypothetical protein
MAANKHQTQVIFSFSALNLVKVAFCCIHVPASPGDKSRSALCKTYVRGNRQGPGDRQRPKQSYRTAMGKRDRSLETTSIGFCSPPEGRRTLIYC